MTELRLYRANVVCCDGVIQSAALDDRGDPIGIGRKSRVVPRRIRRVLMRRDHGMCQFPGCHATHRLHAHHVVHWAHGGTTDLSNLILVCHFHHHIVHEGGWNISRPGSAGADWVFVAPDGGEHRVPVLKLPADRPLPSPPGTGPRNLGGAAAPLFATGERCNIDYVADILIANTHVARNEHVS